VKSNTKIELPWESKRILDALFIYLQKLANFRRQRAVVCGG
jgi:hypothetical protein